MSARVAIQPLVFVFIILLLALCKGPDQLSAEQVSQDAVDTVILREMKQQHIPGISVAVLRNGELIKARGYGLASVELGVSASKDTEYEIASVTKPFTAEAILLLAEEGKLGLEDPLGKHVPNVPESWKRITLRQMLNHTSGIPRDAFPINHTWIWQSGTPRSRSAPS